MVAFLSLCVLASIQAGGGEDVDVSLPVPPQKPLALRGSGGNGILSESDVALIYPTAPDLRSLDPDNAKSLEETVVTARGGGDTPRAEALSACKRLEEDAGVPAEVRRWASVRRLRHLHNARDFPGLVAACHAWLDRYPEDRLARKVKGLLIMVYKCASRDTLAASWNERLQSILTLLAPDMVVRDHDYSRTVHACATAARAVETLRNREASDLRSEYGRKRAEEEEEGPMPEEWVRKYKELDEYAIATEQAVIEYDERILELYVQWESDIERSSPFNSTRVGDARTSLQREIRSRRKRIDHLRKQSYGAAASGTADVTEEVFDALVEE
ncbi:MAG: hypothetical protein JXR94_06745 [Candidatus Hydrogenedentes bacterium]|nr:hypothetical protein [Candidatus Hydrogenedentota bacterium]